MSDLLKASIQALDALENHTAIKHPQQISYRDDAIAALRAAIDRPSTHGEGCWAWGPKHYECACKELAKAKGWAK